MCGITTRIPGLYVDKFDQHHCIKFPPAAAYTSQQRNTIPTYVVATLGARAAHEAVRQELASRLAVQLLHDLLTDVAGIPKVHEQALADLSLRTAGRDAGRRASDTHTAVCYEVQSYLPTQLHETPCWCSHASCFCPILAANGNLCCTEDQAVQ